MKFKPFVREEHWSRFQSRSRQQNAYFDCYGELCEWLDSADPECLEPLMYEASNPRDRVTLREASRQAERIWREIERQHYLTQKEIFEARIEEENSSNPELLPTLQQSLATRRMLQQKATQVGGSNGRTPIQTRPTMNRPRPGEYNPAGMSEAEWAKLELERMMLEGIPPEEGIAIHERAKWAAAKVMEAAQKQELKALKKECSSSV